MLRTLAKVEAEKQLKQLKPYKSEGALPAMTKFNRDYVEKNPYIAADYIEELRVALKALLDACDKSNPEQEIFPQQQQRARKLLAQ